VHLLAVAFWIGDSERISSHFVSRLPISLRDPEIPLGARHAAANRIRDALGHRNYGKAPVEAEAVATEMAPRLLVKVEGIDSAVKAGLEVAHQGIDPTELG
jgi:hypothetical protein